MCSCCDLMPSPFFVVGFVDILFTGGLLLRFVFVAPLRTFLIFLSTSSSEKSSIVSTVLSRELDEGEEGGRGGGFDERDFFGSFGSTAASTSLKIDFGSSPSTLLCGPLTCGVLLGRCCVDLG